MPSAKLTLDFDTRKFLDSNGTAIQAFTGKRSSIREYELSIQQNGVALTLPAGTSVIVALKKSSDPAGTLLFSTSAALIGWGSGSRWFFTLDLSSSSFDAVLNTNVDFDIMILIPDEPDNQVFMSLTTPFKIEKAVQVPSP